MLRVEMSSRQNYQLVSSARPVVPLDRGPYTNRLGAEQKIASPVEMSIGRDFQ